MKPLEVPSTVEVEGEMECELHPKEFFVQVGMLVLEGRTPQQSDKGRIEGKHCAALKGCANHVCDDQEKECKEALSWIQLMELHWQSTDPVFIDVMVQPTEATNSILLLEQWTICIVSSTTSPTTSGSQLLQAISSHIHFSQLSAWLSLTKGVLPYNIKYRMNRQSGTATFVQETTLHIFPSASLPGQRSLEVTVRSLPRCTIQELIDTMDIRTGCLGCSGLRKPLNESNSGLWHENTSKPRWTMDTRSPLRKKTCLKKVAHHSDSVGGLQCSAATRMKDLYASRSSRSDKLSSNSTDLENEFSELDTREHSYIANKNSDRTIVDSTILNLGACSSNLESNGIGNLSVRIERLDRDIEKIERSLHQTDRRFSGLSELLKETSNADCSRGSPKESSAESILEKRASVLCTKESPKCASKEMTKILLQRKCRSLSERGVRVDDLLSNGTETNAKPGDHCLCSTKQSPTRQGTASNTSDVDIHAIKQPVDRACYRRSVQLPIGACTEPVFNPKTGLPVSSSPAPLRRSTNELYEDNADFTDGLASKVDYRELSKLLSRSAPASTTQSLLVNFEESVLNGRMEPVGTVEGFTAELSASGSFCPRHVKLPIISCFYRLSDDDAPSPYMGYISLKDEPIGRRGYHVPKRGTIQLTVFNPNKTVVKMFVVLYDCSDMPPRSQTFLRQKTYSAIKGNVVKNEVQQTLHYLLHLRFASSKSGKIYLHTDIRVIFARQPPDLGHLCQLYTITDGPTDPKFTKRHYISMDPEC